MASIVDEKKYKFDSAFQHAKNELINIRTGRANPSLVENLLVEYYGVKTPLLQLASISAPDPRSILIQPWDKNALKDIEKALQTSPLGIHPINEGNAIRLPIPALTEDRRKELVKVVHQKIEDAKISNRNIREEIWKHLKEQKTKSEISEDDMYAQQKKLQEIIDDYNKQLNELGEKKETEIMTI